jgi:hypothetical protein
VIQRVTAQVTQTKGASLSFVFRLGGELKVLLETEPGVSLLEAGFRPKPQSAVRGKSEYEKRYGYSFSVHISFSHRREGARKPK